MSITWFVGQTLEENERNIILYAIRYCDGNKTKAAEALGISARTIDNKLERYAMEKAAQVSEKRDVPMPERQEIQEMPFTRGPGRPAKIR